MIIKHNELTLTQIPTNTSILLDYLFRIEDLYGNYVGSLSFTTEYYRSYPGPINDEVIHATMTFLYNSYMKRLFKGKTTNWVITTKGPNLKRKL